MCQGDGVSPVCPWEVCAGVQVSANATFLRRPLGAKHLVIFPKNEKKRGFPFGHSKAGSFDVEPRPLVGGGGQAAPVCQAARRRHRREQRRAAGGPRNTQSSARYGRDCARSTAVFGWRAGAGCMLGQQESRPVTVLGGRVSVAAESPAGACPPPCAGRVGVTVTELVGRDRRRAPGSAGLGSLSTRARGSP